MLSVLVPLLVPFLVPVSVLWGPSNGNQTNRYYGPFAKSINYIPARILSRSGDSECTVTDTRATEGGRVSRVSVLTSCFQSDYQRALS